MAVKLWDTLVGLKSFTAPPTKLFFCARCFKYSIAVHFSSTVTRLQLDQNLVGAFFAIGLKTKSSQDNFLHTKPTVTVTSVEQRVSNTWTMCGSG